MKRPAISVYGPRLPSVLARIFGAPPLITGEVSKNYTELFSLLADEHDPKTVGEWLLVKDLTDMHWERLRERRLKSEVVKIYLEQPSEESKQLLYMIRPEDTDL